MNATGGRGEHAEAPPRSRYAWLVLLAGAALLLGLGVSFFAFFGRPGSVTPLSAVSGLVQADCVWVGHPIAWVDTNANGQHDPSDIPLSGVSFEVLDVTHGAKRMGDQVVSDADGRATVRQDLWGCPDIELALRAVAPAGYRNTTDATLPEHSELSYGFAHEQ